LPNGERTRLVSGTGCWGSRHGPNTNPEESICPLRNAFFEKVFG
jgi:hypothetical protein